MTGSIKYGISTLGALKNQYFWPKINILQRNCCILRIDLMPGPQNVTKLNFQSQFSMSFFSFKNTDLGEHFLVKQFF